MSRATWATGTLTSTDVSERPSSRSAIVCVRPAATDMLAARSPLAVRSTPTPADISATCETEACDRLPRSRPEANCTAPDVSATADAQRIPLIKACLETCDMLRPPTFIAPRRSGKQRDGTRGVLEAGDHLTVYKKIWWRRERLRGAARHTAEPVIPPAPLTGDVGRGCGDASRALLFLEKSKCDARTGSAHGGMAPARREARRAHFNCNMM
jgi:hypothetical protein